MVQFYLLAVVFNILGALFLIYGSDLTAVEEEGEETKIHLPGIDDVFIRFLTGLVCSFTGVIKLLSVYSGIPILGDLFPAAACLLCGGSLLLEYFACKTSADNIPEPLYTIFITRRKILGYISLAAGILHFIMPGVVLF